MLRAWLHRLTAPRPTNRQRNRADLASDLAVKLRELGAEDIIVNHNYQGPLGGESEKVTFVMQGQRYMLALYASGVYAGDPR